MSTLLTTPNTTNQAPPTRSGAQVKGGGGAGAPAGLPRTGVVLIGTAPTVRQLDQMLQALAEAPIIAGCVLLDPSGRADGARGARESGGQGGVDLPVVHLGGLEDLPSLASRLNLKCAVVCLPRASRSLADRAIAAARGAGLEVRVVPTIPELLERTEGPHGASRSHGGEAATWSAPASIDLSRLIDRRAHTLDRQAVAEVLTGKRVLITGAGGSIGSELARVCASFDPAQLLLMDRGENALFEIDRQLASRYPRIPRRALLHDVVDAEATMRLLDELRPNTVFHAAAHKHVPLMEDHPAHAVGNNLFGTKSIADASAFVGAERFVMISSDKAVNPTSVMGATKRLAEMYVQALAERPGCEATRMSMVRFGNVLGSAASVLTIWSQQIAEGGPITVTDPRMTRFFMTIPEAATLVMQSATLELPRTPGVPGGLSRAGVFVLDMGEPIAIAELAARFALAHGLSPTLRLDTPVILPTEIEQRLNALGAASAMSPTIELVFTRIRPGEKLHEQLAYAAECLRPTSHPGIRAWAGAGADPDRAERAAEMIRVLGAARYAVDRYAVLGAIRTFVPEMRPPEPVAPSAAHPLVG